jgi:hypothetical protein
MIIFLIWQIFFAPKSRSIGYDTIIHLIILRQGNMESNKLSLQKYTNQI